MNAVNNYPNEWVRTEGNGWTNWFNFNLYGQLAAVRIETEAPETFVTWYDGQTGPTTTTFKKAVHELELLAIKTLNARNTKEVK